MDEQAQERQELNPDARPPEDSEPDAAQADEEAVRVRQTMDVLQKERDDFYNRLLRVSADYQNFQKRTEQNLADAVRLARGDVLKVFIPVLDHFDTALAHEAQSEDAKALYEGVRIVRDELLKAMQCAGVQRIEVKPGDPFDPHLHEALMRHKVPGVEANHITMMMQPGYVYHHRTLRPAKVAVAPQE
jgi:molecular chaperone GrpE